MTRAQRRELLPERRRDARPGFEVSGGRAGTPLPAGRGGTGKRILRGFLVAAAAAAAWPSASLAQAYGTGQQITVLPAAAFRGVSSADQFSGGSYGETITPLASGPTAVVAPLGLPNGAVLEEIRLLITDVDPASNIAAQLLVMGQGASTATTCGPFSYGGWNKTSTGIVGASVLVVNGSSDVVIGSRFACGLGNSEDSYMGAFLYVDLETTSHTLAGAVLVWHRQMAEAPATATFGDVPTTDPFFRAIEALAAAGITSGCGGGNFCPNDVVTRNQLAKFLANALGLHFPR